MFDFFGAAGTFRQRFGIVDPRLLLTELARGAALQVGYEHRILSALPFEIGGGDQPALKFLEAAARVGKFGFGGLRLGSNEDAVKTSLPGVAVDFALDVFGDFFGGDAVIVRALVAPFHDAGSTAHRRDV